MKILLFIRIEQLRVVLNGQNRSRRRSYLFLALLIILSCISVFSNEPFLYLSFPCVLMTLIHSLRKDFDILKKTGLPVYSIILFEYFLLSIPNILAAIISQHVIGILVVLAFILLLPLVHFERLISFR